VALLGIGFLSFEYFANRSASKLSDRIDQSLVGSFDKERLALAKDYKDYLAWGLPPGDQTATIGLHFVGIQRKLLDIRVKRALREIKNSPVKKGETRIWSLLNMGVVIKAADKTIAIDTANIPFASSAHDELSSIADVFFVTHDDSDHYDRALLEKAVANGKKIIALEGLYFKESRSNIIYLRSGVRTNVDNFYATAYQTDHRGNGNFSEENCWYLLEIDGIKILHNGDGLAFKSPNEIQNLRDRKNIDIFLANLMLSPENINDISPKIFVPLHLFKYLQSREALEKSTFQSAIDKYSTNELIGIEMKLLFAGESFLYKK
jgi:hypothetical protein